MSRRTLAVLVAALVALEGCATKDVVLDTASTSSATNEVGDLSGSSGAGPVPTGGPTQPLSSSSASGQASDTRPESCNGTIGAEAVKEVDVPAGATCTLEGTTVDGNIAVGTGAILLAHVVSTDGDVEAEGARVVDVTGSTIGGNVQVKAGGSSAVRDTRIDGDLKWESQRGPLDASGNTIGGNLQADENAGGPRVSANRLNGDLECEQNSPPPGGGGNAAVGNSAGQCANL
jgi:hypothetical protein